MNRWLLVFYMAVLLAVLGLIGGALDVYVYGVDEDVATAKMIGVEALAFSIVAMVRPEIEKARLKEPGAQE